MPLFIESVPAEETFEYMSVIVDNTPGGLLATNINYEPPIITTFGNLPVGTNKWMGGVLAPNGKIYGIPYTESSILELNPDTKTTTQFGDFGTGTIKWVGGVLAPNGKIYGIPRGATTILEIDTLHTPKNPAMCLSAYFNKF